MYKGIIDTITTVAANEDIPFRTVLNTNWKTSPNNGAVSILDPGYWNVNAQINFTGVTGPITAQFYDNGVAIPDTAWTIEATNTDALTATIIDVLKVIRSYGIELARLSVRLSVATTINRAVFIIEEVK